MSQTLPSLEEAQRDWNPYTANGISGGVEQDRCNDVWNGKRFARQFGHRVRYISKWNKFYTYRAGHWAEDDTETVMKLAKRAASLIYAEAAEVESDSLRKDLVAWAKTSHGRGRLEATLEMAKPEHPIPATYDVFDADPWLLNCANGTVDLRTGNLRLHDSEDMLTRTTGVVYPTAGDDDPMEWLRFLLTMFDGQTDLISFNQRLWGITLVGQVLEHILAILHGVGANGKSTYIETGMKAMGSYALKCPAGLLMASHSERHPTELADLYRARLVAVCETGEGQRLDERLCKELTGGDTIRARRMREDFWSFQPSHTAFLVTNHKPTVRGVDHGIWRRLRPIPFNVVIPEAQQDKQLGAKLEAELPLILRWMVQGCLEWQRSGLNPPESVMAATSDYRTESDTFGIWFNEAMKVAPEGTVRASDAFKAYQEWCKDANERPLNMRRFGDRMGERIIGKRRCNGIVYEGVCWHETEPTEQLEQ